MRKLVLVLLSTLLTSGSFGVAVAQSAADSFQETLHLFNRECQRDFESLDEIDPGSEVTFLSETHTLLVRATRSADATLIQCGVVEFAPPLVVPTAYDLDTVLETFDAYLGSRYPRGDVERDFQRQQDGLNARYRSRSAAIEHDYLIGVGTGGEEELLLMKVRIVPLES